MRVARRFYDYCTTVVTYSYMREYFTITQIPEYAGLNQKGDCGVQACCSSPCAGARESRPGGKAGCL